eukprot:538844_1
MRRKHILSILLLIVLVELLRFAYIPIIQSGHVLIKSNPMNNYGNATICTLVLREERFIDEWITYNLALGFDKIYIYDNSPEASLIQYFNNQNTTYYNHQKIEIIHYPLSKTNFSKVRPFENEWNHHGNMNKLKQSSPKEQAKIYVSFCFLFCSKYNYFPLINLTEKKHIFRD